MIQDLEVRVHRSAFCSIPLCVCEYAHLCDFHLLFSMDRCVLVYTYSLIYAPKVILKSVMRKRKLQYALRMCTVHLLLVSSVGPEVCVCECLLLCATKTKILLYHITYLYHIYRHTWSILVSQPPPPPSSYTFICFLCTLISYNHAYRLLASSLHTLTTTCFICVTFARQDPFAQLIVITQQSLSISLSNFSSPPLIHKQQ